MTIKMLSLGAALLVAVQSPAAILESADSRVKGLSVERTDNNLLVNMTLDFTGLKLKSDREVTFIPVLHAADSTVTLPSVTVAGRNRYIQNIRHRTALPGDMLVRPGSDVEYSAIIPYSRWMESAVLSLSEDLCGCGFEPISSVMTDVAQLDFRERTFAPQRVYITPRVETRKERSVKGQAYIDFKVNRTDIEAGYRRNPEELGSIRATIDAVRDDADSRIEGITVTGHASPEGPYENNARLAEGRTAALAGYVRDLYSFSPELLRSASVAEDWDGLRRRVEESQIDNRQGILDIIASDDLTPDVREWKLKSTYPGQYRYLLDNVYPALRRSDYTITYVVSSFSDPAKIAEVMAADPRKLSLHELYILAQSLPADSDRFREVFEVAVRMYPDAPEANLNAGVTALSFGDLVNAERHLAKSGDTPEAVYARAVLAARQGDYTAARAGLEKARQKGVKEADDAMAQLDEYTSWLELNNK